VFVPTSKLFPRLLLCLVLFAGCAEAGDEADDDTSGDDDVAMIDGGGGGQCNNCVEGQKCCGGFCTDTDENKNNCGECGNACDETTANRCQDGMCKCAVGPPCSGGSTCCDGGCKDLMTDATNCGVCGRPCAAMESCVDGMCVCGATGSECEGTLACCSSGCIDTTTDEANCGTCGMACEAGDACTGGACACAFTCPPPPVFPPGKVTCCGDGCYDICNDPTHCGGCDATICDTCELGGCTLDGKEVTPPDFLTCFGFPT
jgi:hypothetical protein